MEFEKKSQIFINNNIENIIEIYNTEKEKLGKGCLFGNFTLEKVDIKYIPMYNIPEIIRQDLNTKMDINPNSNDYMYIFCYDNNDSLLLEINTEK